jgi:hypothetical protein
MGQWRYSAILLSIVVKSAYACVANKKNISKTAARFLEDIW